MLEQSFFTLEHSTIKGEQCCSLHLTNKFSKYDELCIDSENPMIDTEYLANDEYLSSKMLNYECKLNTPNSSMPPDVL